MRRCKDGYPSNSLYNRLCATLYVTFLKDSYLITHASIRSSKPHKPLHPHPAHGDIVAARRLVPAPQRRADETSVGESIQRTWRSRGERGGCPVRGEARTARGSGSHCGFVVVRNGHG